MRLLLSGLALVALCGCSSQQSAQPTATTIVPTTRPTTAPTPSSSPTASVDRTFLASVRALCSALSTGDAGAVANSLMHYQYNSGLRWGTLGDGEGQTSDPSLLSTWLAQARPRCVSLTTGNGGYGAVLTRGWSQPGPAAIIEMDVIDGKWKINDFTFGSEASMARAMQVHAPVLPYRT